MNVAKVLRIVALCVTLFGLVFVAVGLGMYLGFTRPESRDIRIAANTEYTVYTATVIDFLRSNLNMNNRHMYRLQFAWEGNTALTNPRFTEREALASVGSTMLIRVNGDGRAVPIDYMRSGYSTMGFIFMGVFGGIGLLALIASIIMVVIAKQINRH